MVDMAWPDIEKAARDKAIIILPIGVIEEHGPHMGLGVDAYCSYLAGDPASFDPPQAKKFIQRHAGDIADFIEKYLKGEYKPPALD